jgi:hypothetical protein
MRKLALILLLASCSPAYAGFFPDPVPKVCSLTVAELKAWDIPAAVWQWLTGACSVDRLNNPRPGLASAP